jgi:hypothetical protein
MKKNNTALSLLLAACTLISACGSNGSNGPKTQGIVSEFADMPHYVEGTLHNVNVDFNAAVSNFVTNGQTEYKIVVSGSDKGKAVGAIAQRIYENTGVKMETISPEQATSVDQNSHYIFFAEHETFTAMGGKLATEEEIGPSGYQIETIGKNVFINAYTTHGYQLGALAFLREVMGYDMLAEDCVVYDNKGEKMPKMNIVERPDFDYRQANSTSVSADEEFGMGYTYANIFISTGTSWVHNYCDFVTAEDAVEHPEWLSNDSTQYQGCWTARGNQESYQLLVQHIADRLINFFNDYPSKNSVIIGQHDIGGNTPQVQNCKCTACQASFNYYGNTMAGAWHSLVNRASMIVDEYMKEHDPKREYNILELVYHTSLNPPTEKDGSGNYKFDDEGKGIPKVEKWFDEEGKEYDWADAWLDENGESTEIATSAAWTNTTDRVITAPNVHLMWAASSADYVHSFYENENYSYNKMAKAWAGVGGDFFMWLYALNSEGILYPYNSFDSSFDTTRFFKDLGAKYVFWQGQYQNKNNAGFSKLRNYLDSKVEFDVNADYTYYVNKFFKHFYGVGGDIMQEFFEQAQVRSRYNEVVNAVSGNIHNRKLLYKENWPEGLINSWIDLIGTAYDAIEKEYKAVDADLYETYRRHILIEELFPRYVLCTTYESSYKPSDLKALRQSFLDDFYYLENKSYAEGRLMTEVSDTWDLD